MSTRLPASAALFTLVRVVFITLAVLLILTFVAEIALAPGYIASSAVVTAPNMTWTVDATRTALMQLGWSDLGYEWFNLIREVILGSVSMALALLLLWRKSDNWIGLYTAFVFAALGVGSSPLSDALLRAFPTLSGVHDFLGTAGWQLNFILFFFFPDGRFVPRWTLWLLVPWLGLNVLSGLHPASGSAANGLFIFGGLAMVLSALGSQVYRYARRSDPVQRQQTKWVIFAVMVMVILMPFSMLPFLMPELFSRQGASSLLLTLLSKTSAQVSFAFFPISLVIAILRYRLWDIDVIIRRTVTYGLLTALLLAVYFGGVVVLQQLFVSLTGQRSEVAIILSTLTIAALFVPLRSGIQRLIDRRFFRAKYDAQRVMASFARIARDEVDPQQLTVKLLDAVEETLQPERMAVWVSADLQHPATWGEMQR